MNQTISVEGHRDTSGSPPGQSSEFRALKYPADYECTDDRRVHAARGGVWVATTNTSSGASSAGGSL